MGQFIEQGMRYQLTSPTVAPQADAFLWNRHMMIQMTCRGYATAQFMQPEPAKYSHGPTLAAKTFMQPEHPYFAHHPGRFFYMRDAQSNDVWSAPYEPVRAKLDEFSFEPGLSDIRWRLRKDDVEVTLSLNLTEQDVVECWQVNVKNLSKQEKALSLYPYFPVGYASWMNQSADFSKAQQAIVARSVTPYQKLQDYPKQKHFKDLTFLASDIEPTAWESRLNAFEGEGGLHNPDALHSPHLACKEALYELPACIMQFDFTLAPDEEKTFHFLFGPARDENNINRLRETYLHGQRPEQTRLHYQQYVAEGEGSLRIKSPDAEFNHFVNHWLPRQVFYHGDTNRLTTDPQTRNYLQDAMGMAYLNPNITREALVRALCQQKSTGQMPDGILLTEGAELKYINKIPHTDHGVWLIICLQAYLNETGDEALLSQQVKYADDSPKADVFSHLCQSLNWLIEDCDERGLSYIAQGDWCDPMNMVGPEGKGVSIWLTQALCFALKNWIPVCERMNRMVEAERYAKRYQQLSTLINRHGWDGDWYLRGITDQNRKFGGRDDREGQIFLNTQSWALLSGIANSDQRSALLEAVEAKLSTPYGPMLCAPAFTHMHEDIGRVTQKFPGTAENGSVYNHAAMFWCAALYSIGENDRAFDVIRMMLSTEDQQGLQKRRQLPIYAPNYYRGAFYQHPEAAGRSSHLFNTGTAAWMYQQVIEQLCGLKGEQSGLQVHPQLPSHWPELSIQRRFRGADIHLTVTRDSNSTSNQLICNGKTLNVFFVPNIEPGKHYQLEFTIGQLEAANTSKTIIVMGVSGSGKSTVAKQLSEQHSLTFIEGDDFHSDDNIQKMKSGIPLNDEDRTLWLHALSLEIARCSRLNQSAIVSCSALKPEYRNWLRNAAPSVTFIYLSGSKGIIQTRLQEREGHFMPDSLLTSQFETLEIESHEEDLNEFNIDQPLADLLMLINQHMAFQSGASS